MTGSEATQSFYPKNHTSQESLTSFVTPPR